MRAKGPSAEGRLRLDEAIILRAQQGDADAFADLVRQHEEAAFRVAYLIVRDDPEARDVAQEAFIRAYRSLGRFDVRQPFRPWLLRIVTNLSLNSARAAGRRRTLGERYERTVDAMNTGTSPEQAAEASEQARRVWQAIGALPHKDQTLLYLRYFIAASEEETAVAIGRPVGTVKSRMHRALRRLRRVIEEQYPDLVPAMAMPEEVGKQR